MLKHHLCIITMFLIIIFTHSFVYSNNTFYKLLIEDEGIYKIDGNLLQKNGINIQTINPATIKIYNNGGYELPQELNQTRPDGLVENAIFIYDGNDGVFDELDYILFYGKPINSWYYDNTEKKYIHEINHYVTQNVYFLSFAGSESGKRMPSNSGDSTVDDVLLAYFPERFFWEVENINIYQSGTNWYWDEFSSDDEKIYQFKLPAAISSESATMKINFMNPSLHEFRFEFLMNNKLAYEYEYKYHDRENECCFSVQNLIKEGMNEFRINCVSSNNYEKSYLDWIEIRYTRGLKAYNNQLIFNAPLVTDCYRYTITGFDNNNIFIFDITDFSNVKYFINCILKNNSVGFTDPSYSEQPKRYIALTPSAFQKPLEMEEITLNDIKDNSNGADYIIVTHEDFYNEAYKLKNFREIHDDLITSVVKTSDIYNEFSCGLMDPTAIRDFIKYAWENWTIRPSFVLLVGDGDFDYKNVLTDNDKNWIPAYETSDFYEIDSRTMDDYFVCITDSKLPVLSIGRLPVQSVAEVQNIVNKIITYETQPQYGDWKNRILLVADDEMKGGDENWSEYMHTRQAEFLADSYIPKHFEIEKLYLTEFDLFQNSTKPEATEELLNQINRGALIINYIGHGFEYGWAHEGLLVDYRDFSYIKNERKLPFIYAATCRFGRFDNPNIHSLSEKLLTKKDGGALAIFAATRDVYAYRNADLQREFYTLFFDEFAYPRLGSALKQAKIECGFSSNEQKYVLFGDPTVRLSIPQYNAQISYLSSDTLKALSKFDIAGYIQNNGNIWNEYNGKMLVTVFDAEKEMEAESENGDKIEYNLPGAILYKGQAKITDGTFNASFIVPKDIHYGANNARINFYFWNDESDGFSYKDSLYVAATQKTDIDTTGPSIELSIQQNEKQNLSKNFVIYAELEDKNGINQTKSLGHAILLSIEDQEKHYTIDVTDNYKYFEGSFTSGYLTCEILDAKSGENKITLKAWDNYNNASKKSFQVIVIPEDEQENNIIPQIFTVSQNYPNPFNAETHIDFKLPTTCLVIIKIYNIGGQEVRKLMEQIKNPGSYSVIWDGSDNRNQKLASGIYIYQIKAQSTEDSKQFIDMKRMILLK